jgi:hypothetical protein
MRGMIMLRNYIWILFFIPILGFSFDRKDIETYIKKMCLSERIPVDFAYAILYEENKDFNFNARNYNDNGTVDYGLWQLNSQSLENDFLQRYWEPCNNGVKFDWRNPFHNTFIALKHIHWLMDCFIRDSGYRRLPNLYWNVALAYNCGYYCVHSATIIKTPPSSSLDYASRVISRFIGS